MCHHCPTPPTGRRGFLGLAAGALAAGLALPMRSAGATTRPTADEALARLKAGNARYVEAPDLCATALRSQRAGTAADQSPWATILSCSDSRVPPELVFGGVGIGDLFVARNAGNMVDPATMGTLEYGAAELGVPLIVVLGHKRCGAVSAACEVVEQRTQFPGYIARMVEPIVPAALAAYGRPGDYLANAVRESALRTARYIGSDSPLIAERLRQRRIRVVAAVYDLDDGRVAFLD